MRPMGKTPQARAVNATRNDKSDAARRPHTQRSLSRSSLHVNTAHTSDAEIPRTRSTAAMRPASCCGIGRRCTSANADRRATNAEKVERGAHPNTSVLGVEPLSCACIIVINESILYAIRVCDCPPSITPLYLSLRPTSVPSQSQWQSSQMRRSRKPLIISELGKRSGQAIAKDHLTTAGHISLLRARLSPALAAQISRAVRPLMGRGVLTLCIVLTRLRRPRCVSCLAQDCTPLRFVPIQVSARDTSPEGSIYATP